MNKFRLFEKILPSVRAEVIKILLKNNHKGKDAAEYLGMSRSAVSQVIKKKRANKDVLSEKEKQDLCDKVRKRFLVFDEVARNPDVLSDIIFDYSLEILRKRVREE